jgi:hypothetical protein
MTESGVSYRTSDGLSAWTSLRLIGNSTLSKLTMMMPIVGYFILFNDRLVDYAKLQFEVCPAGGCLISWRVFCIYFGLCFAAIGALIFTAFCPHIVKRYATSREFFETSHLFYAHHHNLSWLLDDIKKMKGAEYDDGLQLNALAARGAGIGTGEVHMLSGPMAAYYNLKNGSRPFWRWACLTFYGIGALLLAIPTVRTFLQVAAVALQRAGL